MIKFFKKIIYLTFTLMLMISFTAFTVSANSEEITRIRVGYMNHPGFIVKDGDEYKGYFAEYLEEICKYTKWELEYVSAPWNEQLDKLENGEIDLVGMAQYSQEREERFNFTNNSIGIFQAMLVTLPEEINGIEANAMSCNNKTIGVIEESKNIRFLEDYAIHMGFSYNLQKYATQEQLEMLFSQEKLILLLESKL